MQAQFLLTQSLFGILPCNNTLGRVTKSHSDVTRNRRRVFQRVRAEETNKSDSNGGDASGDSSSSPDAETKSSDVLGSNSKSAVSASLPKKARRLEKWYGPKRDLWLPTKFIKRESVPPYLNGVLPGDFGFDPLKIAKNEERLNTLRTMELINGRWAMLAVTGMILPEAIGGAEPWFRTGAEQLPGGYLNYFASPFGLFTIPLPLAAVIVIELGLMALFEYFRSTGKGPGGIALNGRFKSSVFDGADKDYPGGPFDIFNIAKDPELLQIMKVKEIKNARLAMVAYVGLLAQAAVTGEGPWENLKHHIADPWHYNVLTMIWKESAEAAVVVAPPS